MRVMSEEKLNKLAEFIKQYARDNNGESPSLADIMEYMGMVKSTAYRHVLELEKRGAISYTGKKTLSSPLQRKMNVMFRRIPIVGMIVCGTPDEQEEHFTGYLAVPEEWIDGDCFLLDKHEVALVNADIHHRVTVCLKQKALAIDPLLGHCEVACDVLFLFIRGAAYDHAHDRDPAEHDIHLALQRR